MENICQVLFRQLTQNLSYVQKTGCCLLGEGYGATLAGLIMAADTEGLVKCGALINPVTDWRHMGELPLIYITGSLGHYEPFIGLLYRTMPLALILRKD